MVGYLTFEAATAFQIATLLCVLVVLWKVVEKSSTMTAMRQSNPKLFKTLVIYVGSGLFLDVVAWAISAHWYGRSEGTLLGITPVLLGLGSFLLYRQTCYLLCDFKGINPVWARLVWILGPIAIILIAKKKDGKKIAIET